MDAFEQVVAEILWTQGYWVRTSVKVNLTKAEKMHIDRSTSPRWELDVVAYSAQTNVINVVECKSYFKLAGRPSRGIYIGLEAVLAFQALQRQKSA